MVNKVYVAGLGIISAIGRKPQECLDNIINLNHGVKPALFLNTIHKDSIPVAGVPYSNEQLRAMLPLDASRLYSRTSLLGMIAALDALTGSGIDTSVFRCGLVSATSVGGMDLTEEFYDTFYDDHTHGDIRMTSRHDCGDSTAIIADLCRSTHLISTISTACSSSANAIMYASRLISNGYADCMLAGGTDALTRFTLNGFNTLMILDKNHCKPFDAGRNGLNLGEGAAYIMLVSEKVLRESGIRLHAQVKGFANANDAYHQTASSPEGKGAFLAMQGAINMAGLKPQEISYINVHGTGTQNNDLSEGVAMKRIFGENPPPFSSTKPFTGHTLGAAGAIEAVLSVLAISKGIVYPNLNFSEPIPEIGISPETTFRQGLEIKNVLSNSFGFGGNNSTLIFSAV